MVRATSPAFNSVLAIAGAVVTADGGALSHAAVLARELGIPAVIGASGALSIPDGHTIEVDPVGGAVRLVERRRCADDAVEPALRRRPGARPRRRPGGDPRADGPSAPTARSDRLPAFTDEEWAHPSRCEGWSSRDVLVHLDSTNFFWTQSIAAGLRGEPTRFLATFDPVASPAMSVAQSQELSASAVRDRFVESTDTLCSSAGVARAGRLDAPRRGSPGHVSISAVAHHALWDAWVHERDILLPLAPTRSSRTTR